MFVKHQHFSVFFLFVFLKLQLLRFKSCILLHYDVGLNVINCLAMVRITQKQNFLQVFNIKLRLIKLKSF